MSTKDLLSTKKEKSLLHEIVDTCSDSLKPSRATRFNIESL